MDALTRVPLSQQAADALLDAIGKGRWEVGEQLPGEVALAGELAVSRSTIREAIRQLAARGVLTSRQGIGVFVTSATPTDGWDRLARLGAIAEVVQVRIAIESRAAALAAAEHDGSDAETIRRALAERNTMADQGDPAELARADIAFHRAVVAAARNELLLALFDSLRPRLEASMGDMLEIMDVTENDAHEHTAIVEAILARRADRAEALTRGQLLGLADALRRRS
ncbi:FadR/GntR family transcriptional regulator [Tomitella fengzijianii]|uniref:FadR family transcriptional regulator n=1 Tax=Tomitella fengzijianii TaxID=2597660 RepID=A0A516X1V9_9ACTN|nr:FCD domain-containing protein [Tomitella fengzijianii]QDQ97072.1 FadR family transcriptional regulator [Tomitella fengzijianii]